MANIVRNEIIDPSTLTPAAFESLIDALYAVHNEIFDGVSRDELGRYVVGSSADRTRIQVSYGENGEIAGYMAMHAFRRALRGETCTVVRAEAGLRRAYRGNASTASFVAKNLVAAQWEYAGPTFFLGCLVHPSSYSILAHDAGTVWPAAGVEIPPDIQDLMMRLGDEFHLDLVDPERPLVRKVGWITRDSDVERRYWQSADLPAARFFIEQNPGYVEGHGLLTLAPVDAASMAKTAMSFAGSRLEKNIRRTLGSLERNVLRRPLDAQTAEDLLATVEEITGLDLDAVRQRGLLGTRFPLAPRAVLFRAGERADAMYAVVEGSLFVLDDSEPGNEIVIDQLGPNTIVGEMAMMTGQPRAATVRAAIDTVLLRLSADDVAALFAAEPRLEAELWQRIHGRVFGLELRRIPALAKLSREAQEEWFAQGASHRLSERESLGLSSDAVLVLSKGKLRVEGEPGWMSLSAPSLVRLSGKRTLTATAPSRFAVLPADPPDGVH